MVGLIRRSSYKRLKLEVSSRSSSTATIKTLGRRLVPGWPLLGDARHKDGFDTTSDGRQETSGGVFIELPERCIPSVARRAPDRLRENRSGRWEVFVASFPSFQEIRQVSVAGGAQPRWRGDGRELFFIDNEGQMMSATVERGSPQVGVPKRLFDTGLIPDPTINQYAVAGDGLKFLVLEPRKGFLGKLLM